MIVLSFSFREAPRIPKDVIRFPWEYYVPMRLPYDWIVAERVGVADNFYLWLFFSFIKGMTLSEKKHSTPMSAIV
jgi:hypothetical protein